MKPFSNIGKETELLDDLDVVSFVQKVLRETDLKTYVADNVLSKYRKRHFKSRWKITLLKENDSRIPLEGMGEEELDKLHQRYLRLRVSSNFDERDMLRIFTVEDFKGRSYSVGEEPIPGIKIGAINLDYENKLSIRLDYLDKPGTITWRDIAGLNKWIKETKKKRTPK